MADASDPPPPPTPTSDDKPSDRQSTDALRQIVQGMYTSPAKPVPVQRLPQLIKKLERDTGLRILAPDELGSLEAFANGALGLTLDLDEMLGLLVQVMPTPPPPASSSSTVAPSSSPPPSAAPPTFPPTDDAADTDASFTSTASAGSRSSRIRSASDSSSSSSEGRGSSAEGQGGGEATVRQPAAGQQRERTPSFDHAADGAAPSSAPDKADNRPSDPPKPTSMIPRRPFKPSVSPSPSPASNPPDPASADPPKVPSSWERFSKPPAPSRRRSKRVSADLTLLNGGGGTSSRPPSRASEVGSEDGELASSFGRGGRGGSLPPTPTFAVGPSAGFETGVGVVVGGGGQGGRRVRKARQASASNPPAPPPPLDSASVPTVHLPLSLDDPNLNAGTVDEDWSRTLDRAASPLSASGRAALDESSFFALPPPLPTSGTHGRSSPWGGSDDEVEFEAGGRGGRAERVEMSVGEEGGEGSGEVPEGGVRLQREPSTSSFSLDAVHDTMSSLNRSNADLSRSIASLKAELEAKAADYEVQAAELLGRAEELRVELAISRREEKELRGREAAGQRQIAVFEAEIANLHKALERSRAQHQALVRLHHEQMQASEDLRNVVRERDVEALEARETVEGLRADGEKWARDQQFLEETQARLLSELETARQAEAYLDQQKVENLALKETINRLRADLDELRTNAAASSSGSGGAALSRVASGGRKEEGTMGKSLEKELLRQLMAAGGEEEDGEVREEGDGASEEGEGEGDDSYIETFITTSRRRMHGQRTTSAPKLTVTHDPSSAIRDFHDVGTQVHLAAAAVADDDDDDEAIARESLVASVQTDESALAGLPAYSPREGADDGLVSASHDADDDDAMVAPDALELEQRGWRSAARRKSRSSAVVQNIYNTFHYTRSKDEAGNPASLSLLGVLVRYGAMLSTIGVGIFLAGMQLGRSHPPHMTPFHTALSGDFAAWNAYNDLARGQGVGIGFAQGSWERNGWLGLLGAAGVGAARIVRVPT